VLSPPEDYAADAANIEALLIEYFGDRPLRLLELGAGGGHTLVHLSDQGDQGGRHRCVAADLSEPMLDQCRRLIPGVETHVADMRQFDLDQKFDAVLIHDAIDYLLTPDDIVRTCRSAAGHLDLGGLLLIAPTYTRETFSDNEVADDGTTTDAADLTYFTYVHDPDPTDDVFEMILLYLIRDRATRQVEVVEDRHTCGLFATHQWLSLIEQAGFEARLDESDSETAWTMFVGVKQ
jgi:SAM-dependent methyltransferase